jgi:PHD-zinc-finger like domain/PHD-finger
LGKPAKFPPLSADTFERLIDRFEKEAHQLGQDGIISGQQISNPATTSVPNDDDAICNICGDDECTNTNAILFCDACNLAVHQECYGVPYVPEGQWLCRRCQAGVSADVACCLCPVRGGAVKRTNDGRWAHVVCALWVPEVGFGSIELLEPITKLDQVPPARRRLTCAICSQSNVGACVQCMRKHCYKAFHITCAQQVN